MCPPYYPSYEKLPTIFFDSELLYVSHKLYLFLLFHIVADYVFYFLVKKPYLKKIVCTQCKTSNNTIYTDGAGTAYPSAAHDFTLGVYFGSCYSLLSFLCSVLLIIVCPHCFLCGVLLIIVCPLLFFFFWSFKLKGICYFTVYVFHKKKYYIIFCCPHCLYLQWVWSDGSYS